jgi:hypothetical protein
MAGVEIWRELKYGGSRNMAGVEIWREFKYALALLLQLLVQLLQSSFRIFQMLRTL